MKHPIFNIFTFIIVALLASFPAHAASVTDNNAIIDMYGNYSGYYEGDIDTATLSISKIDYSIVEDYYNDVTFYFNINGVILHPDSSDVYITDESDSEIFGDIVIVNENTLEFVPSADDNISGTIHFKIGGRTFALPINIQYVQITVTNDRLYPKQKSAIQINNYSGSAKFSSYQSNVASVDNSGVITAKKPGWTCIKVELSNGCVLGYAINVAKDKKMIKLIKQAEKIRSSWKYSQKRRGKKGYYDCSSLVWRVYKENKKIKFGTSYYGTTYTELPWCKKKCKYLGADRNSTKYNFQIGDILFDLKKKNTSPYHVETFAGYEFQGFDDNGKPILSGNWVFGTSYNKYVKIYRPTAKKK